MATDKELANIFMDAQSRPFYVDKMMRDMVYPPPYLSEDFPMKGDYTPQKLIEDLSLEGITISEEEAEDLLSQPSYVQDFIDEEYWDSPVMAGEEPYFPTPETDQHTFGKIYDYMTDTEEGFLPDVSWLGGEAKDFIADLPNQEWGKILTNAAANIPAASIDLATMAPQLGASYLQGKPIEEYLDFIVNKRLIPYEEEFPGDAEVPTGIDILLSEIAAIPIMQKLIKKAPNMAQTIAKQWMPAIAGEGWKNALIRSPLQMAGVGAGTAGLGTLFYSKPAGANTAIEPFEGVYAEKPKFDFTYNPNANMNTGIQDRDPVIFDSYMQDKIANFKPRTTAPGPRPNYQGL